MSTPEEQKMKGDPLGDIGMIQLRVTARWKSLNAVARSQKGLGKNAGTVKIVRYHDVSVHSISETIAVLYDVIGEHIYHLEFEAPSPVPAPEESKGDAVIRGVEGSLVVLTSKEVLFCLDTPSQVRWKIKEATA